MSKETAEWLNSKTLIGFRDAWHRDDALQAHLGLVSNHYAGAVPFGDVLSRLFNWKPVQGTVSHLYTDANGETVQIDDSDRISIIRPAGSFSPSDPGKALGIFKGFVVHDYEQWLLQNVSTLLGDTLAIGSAGLLRDGAVAWVQIERPDNIVTPEGVEFRPNLLATTSLDGSLATTYKAVITNVVCDNTHEAALRGEGAQVKIKHSRYSLLKLDTARDALGIVVEAGDNFAEEVAELCKIEVTNQQWGAFLKAHAPEVDDKGKALEGRALTIATNKQDALNGLYKSDPRVAPWAGTAWGVVQAVNTWTQHLQSIKGTDRQGRNRLNVITGKYSTLDSSTVSQLRKVLVNA